MKSLSDYEGDEALELWGDLLEPLSEIFSDKEIANVVQSGASKIAIAKVILKEHPSEAKQILLRIDDTPINGLNIILRLIALLADIGKNEEIKSFFGYAEQAKDVSTPIGFPTANIEEEEN